MSNRGTSEIHWINSVKAFCMFIIYFNHCEIYCEYHQKAIDAVYSPFFVNAFFVVSGYLLFRKQLSESLSKERISVYLGKFGG